MKRILSLVLCLLTLFSLTPNANADILTTACGDAFIETMTERYGEADLLRAGVTIPDVVIVTYNYEKQFIAILHAGMYYAWLLDSVIDVIAVQIAMEEVVESLGFENSVFIISSDSLLEILEKYIT
jgi:hypothetical protein